MIYNILLSIKYRIRYVRDDFVKFNTYYSLHDFKINYI